MPGTLTNSLSQELLTATLRSMFSDWHSHFTDVEIEA